MVLKNWSLTAVLLSVAWFVPDAVVLGVSAHEMATHGQSEPTAAGVNAHGHDHDHELPNNSLDATPPTRNGTRQVLLSAVSVAVTWVGTIELSSGSSLVFPSTAPSIHKDGFSLPILFCALLI